MIGAFIHRAIIQGVPLLYGSVGEIITEKSGQLNLGIPGIMYVGAISGVIGAFFYEQSVPPEAISPFLAILIPLICSIVASFLMGLLYSFLTISLHANQNVTGLALTTFGIGIGNFFGGSLIKLAKSDMPSIALTRTSDFFRTPLIKNSLPGFFGDLLSMSALTYLSIVIALFAAWVFKNTRVGLHLIAVGEDPATADSAGINVKRYKYVATCLGAVIAGLGGLYYIMDYSYGVWSNNGFGDRGWLSIALVIFCVWRPHWSIVGSFIFGGLFIIYNYIPNISISQQELIKMLPYLVTILVLILISMKKHRENLPPTSLGRNYFREER